MQDAKPEQRRRHDREFKQQVLAQCAKPGASVAQIALSHGLNANLVHKWRRLAEASSTAPSTTEFIPVTLAPSPLAAAPAQPIELDLQRGALSVRVRWPASESVACAAWLRELLR
jgi:transposase